MTADEFPRSHQTRRCRRPSCIFLHTAAEGLAYILPTSAALAQKHLGVGEPFTQKLHQHHTLVFGGFALNRTGTLDLGALKIPSIRLLHWSTLMLSKAHKNQSHDSFASKKVISLCCKFSPNRISWTVCIQNVLLKKAR